MNGEDSIFLFGGGSMALVPFPLRCVCSFRQHLRRVYSTLQIEHRADGANAHACAEVQEPKVVRDASGREADSLGYRKQLWAWRILRLTRLRPSFNAWWMNWPSHESNLRLMVGRLE